MLTHVSVAIISYTCWYKVGISWGKTEIHQFDGTFQANIFK